MVEKLKRIPGLYRLLILAAVVLLASAGIFLILRNRSHNVTGGQTIPVQSGSQSQGADIFGTSSQVSPISVRLSEGSAQELSAQQLSAQQAAQVPVATGEPLTPDEIEQLLSRLPALTGQPGAQVEFKLAQGPIPPPRPGATVQEPFPPAAASSQPPAVETGSLKVLRYAPEGEISIAPFINITFNQPMVPLGTLAELSAAQVPVKVDPNLPGTWRWLGTKTLNFQYDSALIDRLPKATVYHVTIPAGTASATGGVLAEAVEWSFTTPPPKVLFSYPPDGPQPLDPLFFIRFDQRVNPPAVLETIHVTAGNQDVHLRLVSQAELQADNKNNWLVKDSQEGRWIAFRLQQPLPADTAVSVSVGPGTPSAEGPLTTQTEQSYSFHTYAPLRIEEYGCNWGSNPCPPSSPFYIRFNNPIDDQVYTDTMVTIQPELPGASINIYGDTLNIQGATRGQTTYTVSIDGSIQDTFGQKLGQTARLAFKVGQAEPTLYGPQGNFVTLDPAAKEPVFSVYSMNYTSLDVKVYAVQPSDWLSFKQYMRDYQSQNPTGSVPGRLVMDKNLKVESPSEQLTEVDIDLRPVMDGEFGHFIVIVTPPGGPFQKNQNQYWQIVQAWVQVTQIGLDAFADHSDLIVWATDLKNGAPLPGVKVEARPASYQSTTSADGTAKFPIPDGTVYLVASKGADQALLLRSNYPWDDSSWSHTTVNDELRWYVFDDRQMYRPGEDVHIKGWIRRIGGKQDGDVGLAGEAVTDVTYQVTGPQGNDLGGGQAKVNALGGFDFVFSVPTQVNLGYAQISLYAQGNLSGLDGGQFEHSFQIQEFRTPEFEVTARNESAGPYFAGEHAIVAVEAKYYAGGALPNAEVTWQVSTSPSSYSPPNWPDFSFGTWSPWWWQGPVMQGGFYGPMPGKGGSQEQTYTGTTDATGTHFLRLDFDQTGEPQPASVVAQATVMDVNRQDWSGTTTLLVHPADLYVGLRSDRVFVERGTPLKVDFIVTDLDGNPVPDRPVEVQAARLDWKYRNGNWQEVEADVQKCDQGSGQKPVTCTFQTPVGGTYRITAVVVDDKGRKNQSQFTRWVSGGQTPPARDVQQEKVTLIPDKETYQPGDVAQILVQSPFSPAEGLLTVNRSGILYTQRFHLDGGTITLKVPIEEKYIPNLNIQVDLTGSAPRSGDQGQALSGVPPRPAYASGQLDLRIPPQQRSLTLQVTPAQKELEPGGETTLDLVLKDARGQPVPGAELAVVIVDEAILALSNYQMADPLTTFYTDRPSDLSSVYARSSIVLANPQALGQAGAGNHVAATVVVEGFAAQRSMALPAAAAPTSAPAAEQAAPGAPQPILARTNFNPLAVFAPSVTTDDQGQARVAVKLPDNLTRYRVMVVAVDQGKQFGSAEANLTARLPLMVRPSAPRFLNFGDRFELPVVLQNQTDQNMVVDVVVRTTNLELTGANGLRVSVPARDRLEIRFPAAAQMAGTAQIQVAATAEGTPYADAATIELPVYTPATTEAFATYGVIDQGAAYQPVIAPQNVFPQYGGLEIETSSTALQALTDAVLYLVKYPYEGSEQMASRILAISALRDVLTAFNAAGLPSPAVLESTVQSDIQTLQGLQNEDGGFPYWIKGHDSIPFNTVHVAHALALARSKGFAVPPDMQQRLLAYLSKIENYYPAWYNQHTRQTLSAYALYVRDLMGDRDPDKALKLINDAGLDNLSLDAVGWLWPVLEDAPQASARLDDIRRLVNNRAVETAGAANFTTSYDDQNYLLLGSSRRTDAILLYALIGDNPQHDLIPKVVNGLLAHRTSGRWDNTQENVFVLLALDRYFNTFEAQTPDFVARIWLGQGYAGSQQFSGRTTNRYETDIPMTAVISQTQTGGGTQNLIISKEGQGRLYYRLGLSYAPTSLKLDALDMGFVVQRTYEGVDDPKDVTRDQDGVWHIKAGARVRVKLTMETDNRRYHVALVDPLPAGLEIVNPALAVSGSVPQDPNSPDYRYGWWWWGTWYEHQNMRDDRAEAFTSLLWDGVYQYSYIARATTPGEFVVPPSKAEEMYSPEVFGRSASDVVIVE